jgi:hypothetical protein
MIEEIIRNRTSWPCVRQRPTDIRICRWSGGVSLASGPQVADDE